MIRNALRGVTAVHVSVETPSDYDLDGITPSELRISTEKRLLNGGILVVSESELSPTKGHGVLSVNITAVPSDQLGFQVHSCYFAVELYRIVAIVFNLQAAQQQAEFELVPTWNHGVVGTCIGGGLQRACRDGVAKSVDTFIKQFSRANPSPSEIDYARP